MDESRTQVTLGVVDRLAVPVLLWTTLVEKFIKLIHQAEWKS